MDGGAWQAKYSPRGRKGLDVADWLSVLLSGGTNGKEPACHSGDIRDAGWTLGREDPMEEGMATHSIFLSGESHGPRSLVGYSP